MRKASAFVGMTGQWIYSIGYIETLKSHLKSIKVNSIECEVLIINWVQCPSHHPGLHLVLFVRQQLQLDVRVTEKFDCEPISDSSFLTLNYQQKKKNHDNNNLHLEYILKKIYSERSLPWKRG